MNYHLLPQDKFIDPFIEDVYTLGKQAENCFWITGKKGDTDYIQINRSVKYVGDNKEVIKNKLHNIDQNANVFVHCYDMWFADIVHDLPNKLYAWLWGYEFYQEPRGFHHHWLYERKTKRLVNRHYYPRLRLRKNVFKILTEAFDVIKDHKRLKREADIKQKQVARIDYLIAPAADYAEMKFIKQLYPGFRAKHLHGFYDYNYDIASKLDTKPKNRDKINILVGNSANLTNNHIDAFKKLVKLRQKVNVHCVLSYGAGNAIVKEIIKQGYKSFPNAFYAQQNFMERSVYIDFLSNIDIFFMYHNRQQSIGNILIALALGKPVFLKKNNPVFDFITNMGLKAYDADEIQDYNLWNTIEEAHSMKNKTRGILGKHISDEVRLANLSKILNNEKYN